jgi:hypothetical protein
MKDVFLIRIFKTKDSERSSWEKMGICWPENKDGSMNFELFMFPGVKFQIREHKKKEEAPF